jgi:hypothetical protein
VLGYLFVVENFNILPHESRAEELRGAVAAEKPYRLNPSGKAAH